MSPADAVPGTGPQVVHGDAHLAAVEAVRGLIAALRVADAPAADLAEAEKLAREATDLLTPHAVHATVMQGALRADAGAMPEPVADDPAVFFPYSPVVGPLNPLAPPAELRFADGHLRGVATFSESYVGPPDMVHGGIIALTFDELLGAVNVCHGLGAFTGTLTIRYERPTPLGVELELDAWLDRTEGRKVFTSGTISHGGHVTARAHGVFIRFQM